MAGVQLLLCAAFLLAQQNPADADWPMFNRDIKGTRYSPLTAINTKNVSQLKQAWTYEMQAPSFR